MSNSRIFIRIKGGEKYERAPYLRVIRELIKIQNYKGRKRGSIKELL